MVKAAELALGGHLAKHALGLGFIDGRGLHCVTAGHVGRHACGHIHGHGLLHRAFTGQAARCQPADGQHRAEQQQDEGPKQFHGVDYSAAILRIALLLR